MTALVLGLVVQASVVALPNQPFNEAAQRSAATGKPLIVLLGADWCPGCRTMKNSVLPEVARTGILEEVEFVYVDVDREPQLAERLLRDTSIPQLLRYQRVGDRWEGRVLLGAQSPEKVKSFIVPEGRANKAGDEKPLAGRSPWKSITQRLTGQ